MADAIVVLNAGSSSLKFSVFLDGDNSEPLRCGQLEGIETQPRFVVRDAASHVVGEHHWASGTNLGHPGAIDFLFSWGRGVLRGYRIAAVAPCTPSGVRRPR